MRLAWDEVQIFGWGVENVGPTQRNKVQFKSLLDSSSIIGHSGRSFPLQQLTKCESCVRKFSSSFNLTSISAILVRVRFRTSLLLRF